MGFRADQQDVLAGACLHHAAGRAQPVQEARALISNVHGRNEAGVGAFAQSQALLHHDATTGETVVWRQRREQDHVHVAGLQAGRGQRQAGRLLPQFGATDAFGGKAALVDPRATVDPLVVGVDAVLLDEIVVGHNPRRHVSTGTGDVGVWHARSAAAQVTEP